jgi:tRNA threonylcarbamoyladenosine biosynthesis protein TsaE
MITLTNIDLSKLDFAAEQIINNSNGFTIWAFYGDMGSGKTTIIARIAKLLGTKIEASSPTFAIINEYPLNSGKSIFHIDCYRLKNIYEAIDIGIEEYLNKDDYIFIEWPEILEPLLQYYDYYKIQIIKSDISNRIISIFV